MLLQKSIIRNPDLPLLMPVSTIPHNAETGVFAPMRERFLIALNAIMWCHYGPPAYAPGKPFENSSPLYVDKKGQAFYHFLSLREPCTLTPPDIRLHWEYTQPWMNYPFTAEMEKYISKLQMTEEVRRACRLLFSSAWSICMDDLRLDQYNHVSFQTRALIYSMFNELQRPNVFAEVVKAAVNLPALSITSDESVLLGLGIGT